MLFLGLQCDRPFAAPPRWSLVGLDVVTLGPAVPRDIVRAGDKLTVRLPDARMSTTHALLSRLGGHWVVEDAGSKNGTLRNGAPVARAVLEDGDLLELG